MLSNYLDLADRFVRGRDYEITTAIRSSSRIAIIAPHGGAIENGTSAIARDIAADDFNLYLFEGRLPENNFARLRLTSHRFDEPHCLALITRCDIVLSVHGCKGQQPMVYTGGLDQAGQRSVTQALAREQIAVSDTDHPYPGRHPNNICNRGASATGIQIECSTAIRRSPFHRQTVASAVRGALEARVSG
jgi:phage replication-related protein YjqB (UPF0714/DUF867 family)